MTSTDNEAFLASSAFEMALANDDGLAAKEHLAAGHPIYYGDERYPNGLIKKYPDGRRQLVAVNDNVDISVIRDL